MFKKIIFSLIMAVSTLSFAQSLDEGKAKIRSIIEDKELTEILENTVNLLAEEQFFNFKDGEYTSKIKDPDKKVYNAVTKKYETNLSAPQKAKIKAKYGELEKRIAETLTEKEKELIVNYITKGHKNYQKDELLFNYLMELKKHYYPILEHVGELTTWTWSYKYYLTPCFPYSENKTLSNGYTCSDQYPENEAEKLESSTVEIAYAMGLAGLISFTMECTLHLNDDIDSVGYVLFLNDIRKTGLMSLTGSSMAGVLNFDTSSTASLAVIKDCDRLKALINNL